MLLLARRRRESDVLYRERLECVECTRPCEGVAHVCWKTCAWCSVKSPTKTLNDLLKES